MAAAVSFFTKIRAHKNAIEWAVVAIIVCTAIYSFGATTTAHIALSFWVAFSFVGLGLWLSHCLYYRKFKLPIPLACVIAGMAILPFLLFTSWYEADYMMFAVFFSIGILPVICQVLIDFFKVKK
ncbi:hypothetical protein [Arenimonas sp. GDDSR-1]|uniref:hypothetical protein n=1 Tax=Arenimonas sp. GDDSR-1 TaxID=2950125 RepID=UPI00260A917C|nr:hypothetical protein [Arenimonas sp. GDDSR-1]